LTNPFACGKSSSSFGFDSWVEGGYFFPLYGRFCCPPFDYGLFLADPGLVLEEGFFSFLRSCGAISSSLTGPSSVYT